jgi:hypothetical protein
MKLFIINDLRMCSSVRAGTKSSARKTMLLPGAIFTWFSQVKWPGVGQVRCREQRLGVARAKYSVSILRQSGQVTRAVEDLHLPADRRASLDLGASQ